MLGKLFKKSNNSKDHKDEFDASESSSSSQTESIFVEWTDLDGSPLIEVQSKLVLNDQKSSPVQGASLGQKGIVFDLIDGVLSLKILDRNVKAALNGKALRALRVYFIEPEDKIEINSHQLKVKKVKIDKKNDFKNALDEVPKEESLFQEDHVDKPTLQPRKQEESDQPRKQEESDQAHTQSMKLDSLNLERELTQTGVSKSDVIADDLNFDLDGDHQDIAIDLDEKASSVEELSQDSSLDLSTDQAHKEQEFAELSLDDDQIEIQGTNQEVDEKTFRINLDEVNTNHQDVSSNSDDLDVNLAEQKPQADQQKEKKRGLFGFGAKKKKSEEKEDKEKKPTLANKKAQSTSLRDKKKKKTSSLKKKAKSAIKSKKKKAKITSFSKDSSHYLIGVFSPVLDALWLGTLLFFVFQLYPTLKIQYYDQLFTELKLIVSSGVTDYIQPLYQTHLKNHLGENLIKIESLDQEMFDLKSLFLNLVSDQSLFYIFNFIIVLFIYKFLSILIFSKSFGEFVLGYHVDGGHLKKRLKRVVLFFFNIIFIPFYPLTKTSKIFGKRSFEEFLSFHSSSSPSVFKIILRMSFIALLLTSIYMILPLFSELKIITPTQVRAIKIKNNPEKTTENDDSQISKPSVLENQFTRIKFDKGHLTYFYKDGYFFKHLASKKTSSFLKSLFQSHYLAQEVFPSLWTFHLSKSNALQSFTEKDFKDWEKLFHYIFDFDIHNVNTIKNHFMISGPIYGPMVEMRNMFARIFSQEFIGTVKIQIMPQTQDIWLWNQNQFVHIRADRVDFFMAKINESDHPKLFLEMLDINSLSCLYHCDYELQEEILSSPDFVNKIQARWASSLLRMHEDLSFDKGLMINILQSISGFIGQKSHPHKDNYSKTFELLEQMFVNLELIVENSNFKQLKELSESTSTFNQLPSTNTEGPLLDGLDL